VSPQIRPEGAGIGACAWVDEETIAATFADGGTDAS
jgi:hypothetical protein